MVEERTPIEAMVDRETILALVQDWPICRYSGKPNDVETSVLIETRPQGNVVALMHRDHWDEQYADGQIDPTAVRVVTANEVLV